MQLKWLTKAAVAGFVAIAAGAGCSLFDSDEARVQVNAVLPGRPASATLHVVVTDELSTWQLEGDDFRPTGTWLLRGPVLSTRMHGTLICHYQLGGAGGSVLSQGTIDLALRRDWKWLITIQPDTTDPAKSCFGCFGSRAFALDPSYGASADSVYVVWSGNSIKNPVVY